MTRLVVLDNTVLANFAVARAVDLVLRLWPGAVCTTPAVRSEHERAVASGLLSAEAWAGLPGDADSDSDVDLLVVVPSADEPAHRLAQAAYRAVGPHVLPLDILVMAREEFDRRSRAVASLPATVLREGQELYAA